MIEATARVACTFDVALEKMGISEMPLFADVRMPVHGLAACIVNSG